MNKKILIQTINQEDGSISLTCKNYRLHDLPEQVKVLPNEHRCRTDYHDCPLYVVYGRSFKECDGILKLDWSGRITNNHLINLLLSVIER